MLNSPGDGPLTPEFSTQQIGNALDWGGVWDTPMAFVYEIGHSDEFGSTRRVLRAGPDELRLIQPRQLGRPDADPDHERHIR